jgi:hypothetical protein
VIASPGHPLLPLRGDCARAAVRMTVFSGTRLVSLFARHPTPSAEWMAELDGEGPLQLSESPLPGKASLLLESELFRLAQALAESPAG